MKLKLLNRRALSLLALSLLLSNILLPSFATAQDSQGPNGEFDLLQPLEGIWLPILNLFIKAGDLEPDQLEGTTRFMIWIAMFAIAYAGLSSAAQFMKGNVSIALAFVIATISAIFMPDDMVILVGRSWGQIAFFLLLLPILAGIGWVAWSNRSTNKWISAAALFMMFYIVQYFQIVYIRGAKGSISTGVMDVEIMGVGVGGILGPIFQVLASIIAALFVIQLVFAIGGGGFGNGQGGGGGWGPFRNWGGNNNNMRSQLPQDNANLQQALMVNDAPMLDDFRTQLADRQQRAQDLENQLRQLRASMTPQRQGVEAQHVRELVRIIDEMIEIQNQYRTLGSEASAAISAARRR